MRFTIWYRSAAAPRGAFSAGLWDTMIEAVDAARISLENTKITSAVIVPVKP